MDVPFISSGAMNRSHYALVRRVETASSPQAADQIILSELDVIRQNLQQPRLSIKACKECLILLLYCTMSLATIGPGDLDFAFPHAVNLAELGQSLMDKKIGYIFCVELIPPHHELQLMLVNTLRKDLESSSAARICLALDAITKVPNEDIIPAVETRLQSLLRHQSSFVRKRAYMAYYTLFRQDSEHLARLEDALMQRNLRTHPFVDRSTLTGAGKLERSEPLSRLLNSQLRPQFYESGKPSTAFDILRALRRGNMKLDSQNIPVVLDIIKHVPELPVRATLREAFTLLSTIPPEVLREFQANLSSSPIASIRHLLTSRDPNDQYLFVSCLSCLDPSAWAGTVQGTTPVLDQWEVQEVMRLLDSRDGLIRKTTLKVLHSVDPTIVEAYQSQSLQSFSHAPNPIGNSDHVLRLLEVVEVQYADDVDQYAGHLKGLFAVVEGKGQGRSEDLPVLETSVERVLNGIRERETSFQISCVTALAVSLTEPEVHIGPTLMVVISALVCDYCGKISTPPLEILRGLARRLAFYAPSVQDACLLSMLRLSAECDEVPEDIINAVHELSQLAGRHLRRRCDQFLALSGQRRVLADVISRAPSSSLPDFLFSLASYQSNSASGSSQASRSPSTPRRSRPLSLSPSQTAASPRKLRYEAYAAPQPVPSLRHLSSPGRFRNLLSSPEGRRSLSRASDTSQSLSDLGRTLTPGELTLAAAQSPFGMIQETSRTTELVKRPSLEDELASRVDLIALDSPFIAEPTTDDPDFEATWASMENSNVRGWCESSLDAIVRLLQSLQYGMRVIAIDQPPFEGELKVLIQGSMRQKCAALRLREGDDESCLWRLRCDDLEMRIAIKRLLEDI
ncbi:ARM repeat-containing protein [Paxillus ammoniavirescens]|nr:ARM repeat-containing protein [Paxillus ammoniavirescens]